MAKSVQYQVVLDFTTNKPSLTSVQQQINQITSLIDKEAEIGVRMSPQDIQKVKKDAEALNAALTKSFNKNTGMFDLTSVKTQLDSAGVNIQSFDNNLRSLGVNGTGSFAKVTRAGYDFEKQVKKVNGFVNELGTTMLNTLRWSLSSAALNAFTGQLQKAYFFAKDLDRSLTDIRIVSGQTADQMLVFSRQANEAAKALKTSTLEYADASLVYFQQGMGAIDVEKMTRATVIGANIAGESTQEMSNLLTATMNGYKLAADQALEVTDKLAAVGATTAADFYELATAMSKVASMANAAGIPMDQLNAQLATIVSVTKEAPESIGTSLKTIYGRMLAFKNNAVDLMEDEDGEMFGAPAVESALEKFSALTGTNISLFETLPDGTKELRDLGTVIEEIGDSWQNTTDLTAKFGLATSLAGSRQQNRLIALFDAWDMYKGAMQVSMDAEGTALRQNELYVNSYQGKLKELQATSETLYLDLIDSESMKDLIGGFTKVVELVTDLSTLIGGIPGIIGLIAGMLSKPAFNKLGQLMAVRGANNRINAGATSVQKAERSEYAKNIGTISQVYSEESVANIIRSTKAILDEEEALRKRRLTIDATKTSYDYLNKQIVDNMAIAGRDVAAKKTAIDSISRMIPVAKQLGNVDMTASLTALQKKLMNTENLNEAVIKEMMADYNALRVTLEQTAGATEALQFAGESNNLRAKSDNDTELKIMADQARKATTLVNGLSAAIPIATSLFARFGEEGVEATDLVKTGLTGVGMNLTMMAPQFISMGVAAAGSATGLTAVKLALISIGTSVWPILAIGAALTAVVTGVKLFTNYLDAQTTTMEEANEALAKHNSLLLELGSKRDSVSQVVAQLKELKEASDYSPESMEKYIDLQNQLGELLPELVVARDAEGNAILSVNSNYDKLLENIDEEIKKQRELAGIDSLSRMSTIAEELAESREKLDSLQAEGSKGNERAIHTLNKTIMSLQDEYTKMAYTVNNSVSSLKDGAIAFDDLSASAQKYMAIQASDTFDAFSEEDQQRYLKDYNFRAQVYADHYNQLQEKREEFSDSSRRAYSRDSQAFNDFLLINQINAEEYQKTISNLSGMQKDLEESGKRMGKLDQADFKAMLDVEGISLTKTQLLLLNGTYEEQVKLVRNLAEQKTREAENSAKAIKANIESMMALLNLELLMGDVSAERANEIGVALAAMTTELGIVNREIERFAVANDKAVFSQEQFNKTVEDAESNISDYQTVLQEYSDSGKISGQTLLDLIDKHKKFIPLIQDEKALVEALTKAVEEEVETKRVAYINMLENSKEYYAGLDVEVKNHYIELLGLQNADLANVQTINDLKELATGLHLERMKKIYADFYSTRAYMESRSIESQIAEIEAVGRGRAEGLSTNEKAMLAGLKRQQEIADAFSAEMGSFVASTVRAPALTPKKETKEEKVKQEQIAVNLLTASYEGLKHALSRVQAAYKDIDPLDYEAQNTNLKEQQSLLHQIANIARTDIQSSFDALKSSFPSNFSFNLTDIFTKDANGIRTFTENGLKDLLEWKEAAKELYPEFGGAIDKIIDKMIEQVGVIDSSGDSWKDLSRQIAEGFAERAGDALKELESDVKSLRAEMIKTLSDLQKASEESLSQVRKNITTEIEARRDAILDTKKAAEELSSLLQDSLKKEITGYEKLITAQEKLYGPLIAQAELDVENFKEKLKIQEDINEQAEIQLAIDEARLGIDEAKVKIEESKLELMKAQLALANTQQEKNVRLLNEAGQWEWVADREAVGKAEQDVINAGEGITSAQEGLEDAQKTLQDALQAEQDLINKKQLEQLEMIIENLEKQLEASIAPYETMIEETEAKITIIEEMEYSSYQNRLDQLQQFSNDFGIVLETLIDDQTIEKLEADLERLKSSEVLSYDQQYAELIKFGLKYNTDYSELVQPGTLQKIENDLRLIEETEDKSYIEQLELLKTLATDYNKDYKDFIKTDTITGIETGMAKIESIQDVSLQNQLSSLKSFITAYNQEMSRKVNPPTGTTVIEPPKVKNSSSYSSGVGTQGVYHTKYDTGGVMNNGTAGVNLSGKPERVLSPEQTESFHKLIDMLPNIISGNELSSQTIINKSLSGQISSLVNAIKASQSDGSNGGTSIQISNLSINANNPNEFIKEMQNIAKIGFRR